MLLGKQGARFPESAQVEATRGRFDRELLLYSFAYVLAAAFCLFWVEFAHASMAGPLCGNGIVDIGETCDDGNTNENDACLSDCQPARCGDGSVQTGVEQCDDGNAVENDGCDSRCRLSDGGTDAGRPLGHHASARNRQGGNGHA
jgi:cysteine-rich repeat protein